MNNPKNKLTMTKEDIKKFMPLMQAMLEGKTIQRHLDDMGWVYTDKIFVGDGVSLYRIKPEPKYRPFKTKEECWNEMLKHQPFGWVKSKDKDYFHLIGLVQFESEFEDVIITFATSENLVRSSHSIYENYIFADGTPFGIKEE